ncbi:4-(cytidine 5'-diphospho)-2-C-methyl-D-erythritol kinase [uncultured Proteiniphilum sp.]|uniref:4-(cytidine 5'-diphospho)-2-C-methyl-D-erythritol kinase n=1 Tax=uncultured Proteiniphilum sp. TaxID=497637 RepID=UPI0026270B63|nr:4-(cytidine 5'-diphospho)-2-C-methyl-D-erythritol kinase [uncultured Proteiniphilum sp.]
MICFPNAKINVGLHIVSRRTDGYHNLETIFYPIGLKDALEIIPAPETGLERPAEVPGSAGSTGSTAAGQGLSSRKFRFFQTGIPIGNAPENNLVIKALNLIAAEKKLPEIDIHLLKKIPSGAGLGGGSSDAAFMLGLLNDTFSLGYSKEELILRAASLGADCPFFILNRPAFATGTGDKLEPIELNLSNYTLLLVKPDIMVSTKEAYAIITPQKPDLPLKEIVRKPPETWRELLKNDFEPPVFKKFPEICRIRQQLYEMGAVYASMSGSGSSVFGLFEKEPAWQGVFSGHFVWSDKGECD